MTIVQLVYRLTGNVGLAKTLTEANCGEHHEKYKEWASSYRIGTIAVCMTIAEELALLENVSFEGYRERVCLASAAACVADDWVDEHGGSPTDVRLFHRASRKEEQAGLELFYVFHDAFDRHMPQNYEHDLSVLLEEFNSAQQESETLDFEGNAEISNPALLTLKERIGGYSALVLHRLATGVGDIQEPHPDMSQRDEAIYGLGTIISAVDDLYDSKRDDAAGVANLGTRGIVTHQKIEDLISCVEVELTQGYDPEKAGRACGVLRAMNQIVTYANWWQSIFSPGVKEPSE